MSRVPKTLIFPKPLHAPPPCQLLSMSLASCSSSACFLPLAFALCAWLLLVLAFVPSGPKWAKRGVSTAGTKRQLVGGVPPTPPDPSISTKSPETLGGWWW